MVSYTRNKKGECLIKLSDFLLMLTNRKHHLGYNHLTTWTSLSKMLEPVAVPDETSKHQMLHLGAANNMNDENDKLCGKGVYFISFSFGPTENIAMWTNYGIPNEEAVKIRFPMKAVLGWVQDFRDGKIRVYGVGPDFSLTPISGKVEAKLVDVAYWSKKMRGRNTKDPNEGLFFYDRDRFRITDCNDVEALMKKQSYLFKRYGWNYEREVRLVLIFDKDLADDFKRVAVPFDKPFKAIERQFSKDVMKGPWFNPSTMPKFKAHGHSLRDAASSVYSGLVKMRSVCDACPKENKDDCHCPYKGHR